MSASPQASPLSFEEKDLLLFCVRQIARPNGQAAYTPVLSNIDWHRLMAAAVRDKALGIVGHALDASGLFKEIPADVRLAFQAAMMTAEANLEKKKRQLGAVFAALQPAKIPLLLIKGISLADTVYHSLPYREMSDIDLMIRPEDRGAALSALAANGFTEIPERNRWQGRFFVDSLGRRSLHHAGVGDLDVHWDPSYWTGGRRVRLDIDGFWRRSIAVVNQTLMEDEADRPDIRRLTPEDDFVLLLLHSLEFRGISLYHLVDLAALMVRFQITGDGLERRLGAQFPLGELPRLHRVLGLLREITFGSGPLFRLPVEARQLAEQFLPGRADTGLSINEVFSHASGPVGLAAYLLGHAFPEPAAYPGLNVFARYRSHLGHYIGEIRRLRRSGTPKSS